MALPGAVVELEILVVQVTFVALAGPFVELADESAVG